MAEKLTKTIRTKVFKFKKLSKEAQDKALDKLRYMNVEDDYWHEYIIDDAKTIGKLLGIEIDQIYFSGFSSQGDGACFTGEYSYKEDAVNAIKEYAPKDEKLIRIAEELTEIQSKAGNTISATITHNDRYSHEYSVSIDVNVDDEIEGDLEERITVELRNFMRWIYRTLEEEYYYQTKDEAIIETIEPNDYWFTADGKLI